MSRQSVSGAKLQKVSDFANYSPVYTLDNGKEGFVYQQEKDGVRYTVLTEVRGGKETFNDFYTNRKNTSSDDVNAQGDTDLTARSSGSVSGAKLQKVSDFANYSPVFYSNAEKAVEGISQNKATAEQWLAMIQKQGGLKAGEDKWLGLRDWLTERKGQSLTKEELLDYIRENQVHVDEVLYTANPQGFEDLKREYDGWLRNGGYDYAWEQLRERFGDDADIAFTDFGGEVVSASGGAKYALEHGLVPVPDGKYSGKDGEYHHIEFESDNGERFVESVPFVDAESVEDDYGIRYSESDGVSARADMDRAHDVAEEWTEKLNLNDDVQIVDELTREMVDELMPNASEEVKEKALKAKGWFNEKTGKIVISVGNHRNAEDVMQTILHEGVAHYGLRKLFGENFNTFLDNVYASADASVRKRIDVLQENKGYGRREAVEEYLAGLAEVTDFESVVSRTWWEKVKSLFSDMLNSIGLSGFADNSLPVARVEGFASEADAHKGLQDRFSRC